MYLITSQPQFRNRSIRNVPYVGFCNAMDQWSMTTLLKKTIHSQCAVHRGLGWSDKMSKIVITQRVSNLLWLLREDSLTLYWWWQCLFALISDHVPPFQMQQHLYHHSCSQWWWTINGMSNISDGYSTKRWFARSLFLSYQDYQIYLFKSFAVLFDD